jgi:hypothetical protein
VKKMLTYGTGLIALYLVVANASGSGRVFTDGANGLSTVTRTLQGR